MQYVGWKAFKITDPSEVFLETELIYNLQNQALKILDIIKVKVRDNPALCQLIIPALNEMDPISDNCNTDCRNLEHIGKNLSFIFSFKEARDDLLNSINKDMVTWNELYQIIISLCYQHFLNDTIKQGVYLEVKKFLFCDEIKKVTITNYQIETLQGINSDCEWKDARSFFKHMTLYAYIEKMSHP